jgi:hypothetical protein
MTDVHGPKDHFADKEPDVLLKSVSAVHAPGFAAYPFQGGFGEKNEAVYPAAALHKKKNQGIEKNQL